MPEFCLAGCPRRFAFQLAALMIAGRSPPNPFEHLHLVSLFVFSVYGVAAQVDRSPVDSTKLWRL